MVFKILRVCLFAVLLGVSACSPDNLTNEKGGAPAVIVGVNDLYRLQLRIDPQHPGRGVTDYPGNKVEDVPKSYAMVLLAELSRKRHAGTANFLDLELEAAKWLMEHADENRDGVIGWGVPVAWDAYGDGSVNPVSTEYSISTAIVIDALLSWSDAVSSPKAIEVLKLLENAAKPYLNSKRWTPAGMLPYSLRENDRKYDTFNSAMYLAGQFQRLAQRIQDKHLANRLTQAADSTVSALLRHKQISPETGAWYWYYSVSETVPNDLPHASYIAQGLADYVKYGGRLADHIDLDFVFDHINEFIPEKGGKARGIRAWPRFRQDITLEARSYDIGMAMHLACSNPRLFSLRSNLINSLGDYRTSSGEYLKYPVNSKHTPLVVAEYESYLYRGLATCLLSTADEGQVDQIPRFTRPEVPGHILQSVDFALLPPTERGEIGVPFVQGVSRSTNYNVFYSQKSIKTRLELHDGRYLKFDKPGFPLALIDSPDNPVVFFREYPQGNLFLIPFFGKSQLQIRHAQDREPIYRTSILHKGVIYLVYYDNPTSGNWLVRISPGKNGWGVIGPPVKLPSLKDPAGATYEMIPRMEFLSNGDKLWLTGGTLRAEIMSDGQIFEEHFEGCLRAVEVVLVSDTPVALCASSDSTQVPWVLAGQGKPTLLDPKKGIPWNLRVNDKDLLVDYAVVPQDLSRMLMRDLSRTQQEGWMEFGINNDEGRIPWSQIYYLNGFLDMVSLARSDVRAAEVFLPLLPLIRQRLDLEMQLIDQHWRSGRYRTRAFTVDRSPALFAVQTARLLLLMQRYLTEIPLAKPLPGYADVQDSVASLRGHIDVLARKGESSRWIQHGRPHLRWPKGSKFYFDGLNVPFNHQNEWAYSILRAGTSQSHYYRAAEEIIGFFKEKVASGGELPAEGVWDYWWGRAYDGWVYSDGVSLNKPSYPGDKIKAWISFRTIDAMALVSAYSVLPYAEREIMLRSVARLVHEGKLYPFAAYELYRLGMLVFPSLSVAQSYARVSAPWELQSAVWALSRLAQTP